MEVQEGLNVSKLFTFLLGEIQCISMAVLLGCVMLKVSLYKYYKRPFKRYMIYLTSCYLQAIKSCLLILELLLIALYHTWSTGLHAYKLGINLALHTDTKSNSDWLPLKYNLCQKLFAKSINTFSRFCTWPLLYMPQHLLYPKVSLIFSITNRTDYDHFKIFWFNKHTSKF